jgi:hypothetical protein
LTAYHRVRDDRTIETDRLRFRVSGDYAWFGLDGTPVFRREDGALLGQLRPDGALTPLNECEWSPSARLLPAWVEFELFGRDQPDFHCRVELRDGVPRLVELGWSARETQGEIRQKHLRAAEVSRIANLVYATWVVELRDVWRDKPGTAIANFPGDDEAHSRRIEGFLHDLQVGRRHVNTEVLRQVAQVYRANFDRAPTEAVARTFGVKQRMAHEYVRRARERGFLPPTTQGKKRA